MTVLFESTRGKAPKIGLVDAALSGLAPDGGLYVPCAFPAFSRAKIESLKGADFLTVATAVLTPFFEDVMDHGEVAALVKGGFSRFSHPDIVPIKDVAPNILMMELFHGPTLAFKDVALQVFGRLLDKLLERRDQRVTIIGATSGDTGSAAIHAVKGSAHARIFMLHPVGRVSDIQRRQMTSVLDENVVNIAVEGSFDDAQAIVKNLLSDPALRAEGLTTVNSINWVRVMVQVAYHAYAALTHPNVDMVVPSGNFGNAYAGHVARKMGFPVGRIVIATNENDILVRALQKGDYSRGTLHATTSPAMDIQVASNFERLLFELLDHDATALQALMDQLDQTGGFQLYEDVLAKAAPLFATYMTDEAACADEMRRTYQETGMLVDPHTAVGLHAARAWQAENGGTSMVLSTAHPSKFPDVVEAATGVHPDLPPSWADLLERGEKCLTAPADHNAVRAIMKEYSI